MSQPKAHGQRKYSHEICDFYLSQGLSGHGCYGSYLRKMNNRRNNEECRCDEAAESPEHIFTECPRHSEDRPQELIDNDANTRMYLRKTVMKLWKEEIEETRKNIEVRI